MPGFDALNTQLLADLDELVTLLRSVGEDHWATWMERDRARIAAGDGYGLIALLGAYGGMGSFNDLIVHPLNGHQVDEAEAGAVNERVSQLRSSIWTSAQAMTRELGL